jgi:hypothetical protein
MRRTTLASLLAIALLLLAAPLATGDVVYYQARDWDEGAGGYLLRIAADDGSASRSLGVHGQSPLLSPDGTRVAYFAQLDDDRLALDILTIASGAIVRSTPVGLAGPAIQTAWSGDSARLSVGLTSARPSGILTGEGLAVVDASTGGVVVVVPPKGRSVGAVAWSPDGSRLAYSDQPWSTPPSRAVLRIAGADGTGATTHGRGSSPLWSPTGDRIAYQRWTPARWRGITVYRSQIRLLAPGGARTGEPLTSYDATSLMYGPYPALWTPNGRTILGQLGGEDVTNPIRVDAATGRISRLRVGGRVLRDAVIAAVSADGRTLLVQTGVIAGRPRWWTVPVAGGRATRYPLVALGISTPAGWQP